jgi:hypothetical protein
MQRTIYFPSKCQCHIFKENYIKGNFYKSDYITCIYTFIYVHLYILIYDILINEILQMKCFIKKPSVRWGGGGDKSQFFGIGKF